ncbi:MAG: hypothetical protein EBV17_05020, partial [Actinobacteria bacterium]|nr:hypothetical protein [Actinomycetota bacterium]
AIFVDERTQGDIASELGVRRETIVRRYGRLIERLQEKGFDTSRLKKKRHKPSGNKKSRSTKNRNTKNRNTTKGVK